MILNKNKLIYMSLFFVVIIGVLALIYISLSTKIKTDAQVFEENINKAVEIRISDDGTTWGYGTGCFIDKNGLIITNKHMVVNKISDETYRNIQVRLPTKENFIDAQVVKISSEDDLAMIKIDISSNCFILAKSVKNGERIFAIGNPNGFGLSFIQGNVSSNQRNVLYGGKTIYSIQTSFVVNEGNSGGPVFNVKGELIGLISFRLKDKNGDVIQGVSFAIPASIIEYFICEHKE